MSKFEIPPREWSALHVVDAIHAELRIVALGERRVTTKSRKVLLLEWTPSRLRFKTTLWLAPGERWTVALKLALDELPFELVGRIVEAMPERHWWTYEVELRDDPVMRTLAARVLNERLRASSPAVRRIHEAYRKQMG